MLGNGSMLNGCTPKQQGAGSSVDGRSTPRSSSLDMTFATPQQYTESTEARNNRSSLDSSVSSIPLHLYSGSTEARSGRGSSLDSTVSSAEENLLSIELTKGSQGLGLGLIDGLVGLVQVSLISARFTFTLNNVAKLCGCFRSLTVKY